MAEVAAKPSDSEQGLSPSYAADGQIWLGIAELRSASQRGPACLRRALEIRRATGESIPRPGSPGAGLAAEAFPGARDEQVFAAAVQGYRAWGLAHPLLLEALADSGY